MSPRGGARPNSGRPSRKLPITKVTAYIETRDLLTQYAESKGYSVVELLYRIVHSEDFTPLIDKIPYYKDDFKQSKEE